MATEVKNWRILLVQSFTARVPLLAAEQVVHKMSALLHITLVNK